MAAKSCCMGQDCSNCSIICNDRIIQCDHCGESLQLRVRGIFPKIGFIDGANFTFPCDPPQVIRELENSDFDLFTFLQKPGEEGVQYPYRFELDNLAILPVSTFDHWWEKQIGTKVRNQVRRSEKRAVVVQEERFSDELLHGICEIYNETPIRQGRRFPHYGMSIEKARVYAGTFPNRAIFVAARVDGKIVGFSKMVTNKAGDYASFFHLISFNKYRDRSVNNALIAGAVRACSERGIRQLAFDNFGYGKKTGDSLTEFKVNNGFQRVDVPRYYITRNVRGTLAYKLGLHHRLSERIPEGIASRFRQIRAKWYSRVEEHSSVLNAEPNPR